MIKTYSNTIAEYSEKNCSFHWLFGLWPPCDAGIWTNEAEETYPKYPLLYTKPCILSNPRGLGFRVYWAYRVKSLTPRRRGLRAMQSHAQLQAGVATV